MCHLEIWDSLEFWVPCRVPQRAPGPHKYFRSSLSLVNMRLPLQRGREVAYTPAASHTLLHLHHQDWMKDTRKTHRTPGGSVAKRGEACPALRAQSWHHRGRDARATGWGRKAGGPGGGCTAPWVGRPPPPTKESPCHHSCPGRERKSWPQAACSARTSAGRTSQRSWGSETL